MDKSTNGPPVSEHLTTFQPASPPGEPPLPEYFLCGGIQAPYDVGPTAEEVFGDWDELHGSAEERRQPTRKR